MKSYNMIILVGNLGKDPRMAYNNEGLPICNFDVATSEHYKTSTGEWKEDTDWHRIVVFGNFAEICGTKLKKGAQVFLTGRAHDRSYKTESNETRVIGEIIARDVIFTGKAPVIPKEQDEIPINTGQGSDTIPF